jgi:DNA replication and repair protein RecF
VIVRHLILEQFRNIERCGLDLPPGQVVLFGENAQGKSNILEALAMLAWAKSLRAENERCLIRRESLRDPIPYTRIAGAVQRFRDAVQIDIVLQLGQAEGPAPVQDDHRPLLKRIKVNGMPRKAGDVVGEVQAILFEPQDIELVYGPPALRRRHLDLTLSQVDRTLLHELQRYNRVLAQRNPLLKAIREGPRLRSALSKVEGHASPEELAFWDAELAQSGAAVTLARRQALAEISLLAHAIHGDLTGGAEDLHLSYRPSLETDATNAKQIEDAFRAAIAQGRQREIAAGVTLTGPHRDDFTFDLQGADLAQFGSRGQQRLATLALKLAEAQFMQARAGEAPLLLLDDILSELDPPRRRYLLDFIARHPQAIVTTADTETLAHSFPADACLLRVDAGRVTAPAPARMD